MMKLKFKVYNLIPVLFVMAAFISCKKKETPAPELKGDLYFHMHSNINTTEADSGMVCADASGKKIQLNIAQFYISGVVLRKPDGTNYALSGMYALKTLSEEIIKLGPIPSGNYSSVSFNVGIDAATNLTDPSSHSGCLSAQSPPMWFGSTAQGYIFMNVQGLVDTTAANNGAVNFPFSYQLGTSNMFKTVTMPTQQFTVVGNQSSVIHLTADYGKLLQGISFKTQGSATPFSNSATAVQIANNIPSMFRYE